MKFADGKIGMLVKVREPENHSEPGHLIWYYGMEGIHPIKELTEKGHFGINGWYIQPEWCTPHKEDQPDVTPLSIKRPPNQDILDEIISAIDEMTENK